MAEVKQENRPQLIDTDVHNTFPNREALLPYLPKVWHKEWLEVGYNISTYFSQVGKNRLDARTPDGGHPGSDPHFLLEHHIEKYNIDYGILTHSTPSLSIAALFDPDYADALAAAHNDYLVDKWLSVSPKFKGSILINSNNPEMAAKEIDRMASHPGMVQVIMASTSRMPYGQRFYHPIYEAAEHHGLPVVLHPGSEGSALFGAPTPSGFPTRYLEYHNILPINFMAQVNSLICEGVFEKFPHLVVVAMEGGVGWAPHLMWRMDKNYKALRDTVPWLKELPSEYIKRHIRFTTQPLEEPSHPQHLTSIIEMAGLEDNIMFSSDYPHWDFDHPELALNRFPKELRHKIKVENALKLYKKLA